MRTTLAISCCFLLACDKTPEPAAKAEPAKTAEPAAKIEPTAKTEPAPKPEPTIAPPSKASIEAGVPEPDAKAILDLARAAKLEAPTSAAPTQPFGPRQYVAILRTRKGAEPATFGLHALLLKLPEGDGATWTLAGSLELLSWSREWSDDADAGSIPTSIFVDDYEDDGELELLVRFRNEIMCGGGGPNEVTTLMLVELSETPPRITLQTEIDHALSNGAAETTTKVGHEDLDADGHRDLKIVYRSSEEGEPETELAERRWRWDASTDTWLPLSSDGSWTAYARGEGCDW